MKEENNIKEIEEIIKNKKKLSKDYNKTIKKKVLENIILAIIFTIYYYLIFLGSVNIESGIFLVDLKTFSFLLLAGTIIIFEISYKKDNDSLALHGIEVLISAFITLFSVYIYSLSVTREFKIIIIAISIVTIVYYIIKSLIIHFKMQNKYIKSNDDIKKIIQK